MLWILFSMWRFFRWTDKDAPWPKIEKKCHHIQSNKCILVHKVENLWDWKRPSIFHKLQKRLSENATLVLYLDSSKTKRVGIPYEIVPIIFIYLIFLKFSIYHWINRSFPKTPILRSVNDLVLLHICHGSMLRFVPARAEHKLATCILKYGFCKKSLRKNATLTSWTL